jgi:hypothetical protein
MLQLALSSVALAATLASKPCSDSSLRLDDADLAHAAVAKGLAGTQRVALDASGTCIDVEVNSYGTARLVALILRSLDVPYQAVRYHVVS